MSESGQQARSVVIERTFPHAPTTLWRALTEPGLLSQWLMSNDFEPILARPFQFRATPMPHWDGIIHCELLVFEPPTKIGYTWRALGLESTVVFTLTPGDGGTHLRMEHSGFRADQNAAFHGAERGWQSFLTRLEEVLKEESR